MSKALLSDYIKLYEKTLTPEQCNALIERFEAASAHHEVMQVGEGGEGADGYSFVQLNVSQLWPDVEKQIARIMDACLHQYHQSLDLGRYWPPNPIFESVRLKRYLPNGRDSFAPHVDVMDDSHCFRFATAILYLNTTGGGETVFPDLGLAVPPEPGRLLVFPPLWTFVHAGMPPRDRPKYILHSYLWYPPRDASDT